MALDLLMAAHDHMQQTALFTDRLDPGPMHALIMNLTRPPHSTWPSAPDRNVSDRLAAMHILVVDDDQAVRDSLARSLEYNDYEVSTAEDGVEALAKLAAHRPDAVIMDVMMPRLDGLETTRMLRSAGNDVPILVLTARDAVGDRVDGLDAGGDDYMAKPFALDELLARLRALVRRSGTTADSNDPSTQSLQLRRPGAEHPDPRGAARRPARSA